MNRKKGFTLAELLGAVVVLMLILLLAIPPILNHINKSKGKLSGAMENIIFSATDLYIDSNRAEYLKVNGLCYCTTLKDLVDNNFLSEPLIDPETMAEVNLNKFVKSTVTNKNYYHEITDTCNEIVMSNVDDLKANAITIDAAVTIDDKLYLDSDNVYRYKGSNPNNYIMLGEEKYRIIAIEDQGIKVVKSDNLSKLEFDTGNVAVEECSEELGNCPRNNSNNTYCQVTSGTYNGCNVYASADEISKNGVIIGTVSKSYKVGTVNDDSTIYKHLHTYYSNNLGDVQQYINEDVIWDIGTVNYLATMLLDTVKAEQTDWNWTGKIGLINLSDYIQAQLPSGTEYESCSSNLYNNVDCRINNWMNFSNHYWTINSYNNFVSQWYVHSSGKIVGTQVYRTDFAVVRPVVYLKSDINLIGSGTELDPYKIIDL